MRYFWLTLFVAAEVFTLLGAGWEAALGLLIMVCAFEGIWVIAGWIVGALLRPQEQRSELVVREVDDWTDYHWTPYTDPTRPQPHEDEHPVIVLDNYRWRRTR